MTTDLNSMRRLLLALASFALVTPPAAHPDTVRYYHLDGLGSVRAVTNQAGVVVERHDYLPYGEECTTGPCAANPGVGAGQPRKFTGKERDVETGLDYFGARYYGSKIARFTTVDPFLDHRGALVDPQRWNRYAYGRNNPFRYVDPDGRDAQETLGRILHVTGAAYVDRRLFPEHHRDNYIDTAIDRVAHEFDDALPMIGCGIGGTCSRGGIQPVLKGREGVTQSMAGMKARGEQVTGTEVTIDTAGGRVRLDLTGRGAKGEVVLVESKKGPKADLSKNQKAGFPALEQSGGVPRGKNAQNAGLEPGQSIPPTKVKVDRHE